MRKGKIAVVEKTAVETDDKTLRLPSEAARNRIELLFGQGEYLLDK
jgi:hypothetical protein